MDDIVDFEETGSSWKNILNTPFYVFENYGWHLLVLFITLTVIYHKTLKSYIEKYKEHKFEREYAAKYHKNPDVFAGHVNAQQQWVQKMQDKYNKESEESEKKTKEREEKKRQELMEKYDSSLGYTLGSKKDDKHSGLKQDYNPLMGGGNSSSYRPQRRSPCGGGGCGR